MWRTFSGFASVVAGACAAVLPRATRAASRSTSAALAWTAENLVPTRAVLVHSAELSRRQAQPLSDRQVTDTESSALKVGLRPPQLRSQHRAG